MSPRNKPLLLGLTGLYAGLIFPIAALVLDIWFCKGQPLSVQSILLAHQTNSLHFVIDLAPLVLGFTFYYIGICLVRSSLQKKRLGILLNQSAKSGGIPQVESLLELSEASIFSINTSWEYILFNREHQLYMEQRFGITICKGDNLKAILEEQGSPARVLFNQLTLALGKNAIETTERERYVNQPDQFFESRYSPILDEKGSVGGVNAFRLNVTQRHKEFIEARENHRILNNILNHLPMVIYKTDSQGIVTLSVGAGLANFGLKPNQLVGTNVFQRMPQHADEFKQAINGELVKFTSETNTSNGDWYFDNYIMHSADSDGGITGFAIDVTNAHQAETRFRDTEINLQAVIENTADTIWSLDMDMHYTALNTPSADLLQALGNKRPAVGEQFDFISLNYDVASQWAAAYRRAYAGERFTTEITFKLNGNLLTYEQAYNPLIDEQGRMAGITVSGQNISQRKENEQALIKARRTAEESTVAKARFLSMLSHEIRTPLHSVIGFINLLQSDSPQQHQQEYLNSLKFSAGHLHELLTSVLDYSKLEEGQIRFEHSEFDFSQLLSNLIEEYELQASDKNLELCVLPHKPIVSPISGDALRLKQVISNLLSNAIKFTAKGTVNLGCQVVWETANLIRIRVSVTDTGIGISRTKQSLLFDRFTQLHDIDMPNEGSGLGLAICKTLVEAQGGRIGVNSLPGEGSTFFFELSFEKSAIAQKFSVDKTHFINPTETLNPMRPKALAGLNVLIVEDHAINRLLMRKFLERQGATSDMVSNGKEAIEKVNEGHYHAVLMDLFMPETNGIEATRHIRKQGKTIPIIACTANASDDIREQALDAGVSGFIKKPFIPTELYRVLWDHTLGHKHD